jgi:Ca2+/Na+ antiporter
VCGPLLALPVLGNVARIAERGRPDSAVATLVAIALLNLCAVLPTVVMVHYVPAAVAQLRPHISVATRTPPTTSPTTAAAVPPSDVFEQTSAAMPYPMVVWRVDTLALVVIGFGIIPWAMGRWAMGRAESVALIISYALYLALLALLSTHWG